VSKVTPEDLEAFVQLFEASDWDHVDVEMDDFALHLSKKAQTAAASPGPVTLPRAAPPVPSPAAAALPNAGAVPPPPAAQALQTAVPAGAVAIKAPHLGTFYLAPKPGQPPYVTVGSSVCVDTEVGMMEVMKLFTTLRAATAGVVKEVRVKDGQLVESGDVLFVIAPDS
jgi:acetyl-CoA carboxylase biotin carboxyl carrier protein